MRGRRRSEFEALQSIHQGKLVVGEVVGKLAKACHGCTLHKARQGKLDTSLRAFGALHARNATHQHLNNALVGVRALDTLVER